MVYIIKARRRAETLPPMPVDGQQAIVLEPLTVRIPDAVRMTGIGRSKLYELIQSGDIAIVKIGASTLIPIESLRQLIDRHRQ